MTEHMRFHAKTYLTKRDMKDVEQDLIRTALPYWEAEAMIVRRFFKKRPTREDHIFWLKAQLWKELHPVDGYFTGLQKELNDLAANFSEIDKSIDRHQYHLLLEQLTQEFNHYVLMADVLEYLLGHPVSAEDTFQLPQEKNSVTYAELTRRRVRLWIKPLCSSPKGAAPGCSAKAKN